MGGEVERRGFHPGALAGRLVARAFRSAWPRGLLLNGLRPEERVDLALDAIEWGELQDQAGWRVLARFAGHVKHDMPEAERFAVELARAVSPGTRSRIHDALRGLVEGDDRSLAYGLRVFRGLHEWLAAHAGGVEGKRILELGPGYTLVPGLLLVASGAESWTGADLYPLASLEPGLYRALRAELADDRGLVRGPGYYEERRARLARLDAALRFEGERVVIDERRVAWHHSIDSARLPFADGSFEVCLSNATLEHVRDPAAVARESVRVLAPGGVAIHQIDLRDHRDTSRPLEFLRDAADDWEARFREGAARESLPAFTYTNRWRRSDFVRAFEAAGGRVVHAEATERATVGPELRAGLHADFRERSQDDLETVSLKLVVERAPS